MKIIFMGTPEFAVPIFKSIYNSKHKIISVYTQPPKKKIERTKNYGVPRPNDCKEIKY